MSAPNKTNNQRNGDVIRDAASKEIADVLQLLDTTPAGLASAAAAERMEKYGPNEVGQEKKHDWLWRLWVAVRNPLVVLLTVLAVVTFVTAEGASDMIGGWVMVAMVAWAFRCGSFRKPRPIMPPPSSRR
jgi:Mg2+-importing ATPase